MGRWVFIYLCVNVVVYSKQQETGEQQNPFIIHQQLNRQQEQKELALQQLQQQQLHIKSPLSKETQTPRPSPSNTEAAPRYQNNGRRRSENRNEMHKGNAPGGPGPTAWTRWTSKPKLTKSPWQDIDKENDDMALCGKQRYSARDHICCQNTLQKRQGLRPACCGRQSFDFVFNLCCSGKITSRTANKPFC